MRVHKRSGKLELPFRLEVPHGAVEGVVYLNSSRTPLALGLSHIDEQVRLSWAWSLVPDLPAARYCGERRENGQPEGFTATTATARRLASIVGPHKMRLRDGARASDDAVLAAEQIGIELEPGETWRKGHVRDGESGEPLRFVYDRHH